MLDAQAKKDLLEEAAVHVAKTREKVKKEIEAVHVKLERFRSERGGDQAVRNKLSQHFSERLDQLHHLFPNPYFFRCDVQAEKGEAKTLYFSKFSLMEHSVFSWTAPAARLRFADVGPVSYALLEKDKTWKGTLARKDQFTIAGGKIVFMASEADRYGRTVVHHEQFVRRKEGFVLPEIVERMERAQDDVIRAPTQGSFLIAGPAGSGKTTLAFHRLAYLLQSPETSEHFSSRNVIVFVQDEGTRAYFSRLLPDLGIHEVYVTTFGAWAMERLALKDATFVRRPNGVDPVIDGYEQRKCAVLRSGLPMKAPGKNLFAWLDEAYKATFTPGDKRLFKEQRSASAMDRFDLSLLLQATLRRGPFTRQEEYLAQKKNFEVTRKQKTVPLSYALIMLDEAQNYLPEQIQVLRSAVSADTQAMLYVGDLDQQVFVGTVRDWSAVGEQFAAGQKVQLEKVYRNTKAILRYVADLGFPSAIPNELREGIPVEDRACASVEEQLECVRALVGAKDEETQIGILAPDPESLTVFKTAFEGKANIHVLTFHQAQGVEFDCVCLVGLSRDFFADGAADEERLHIKRDLVYVALTRAMDELHVFGKEPLGKMLSKVIK